VSRYQKGKTNLDFTEARDGEWQWHQLGHMQICTSLQTKNHASTPPLSFYRPDALPAAIGISIDTTCQSTEGENHLQLQIKLSNGNWSNSLTKWYTTGLIEIKSLKSVVRHSKWHLLHNFLQ